MANTVRPGIAAEDLVVLLAAAASAVAVVAVVVVVVDVVLALAPDALAAPPLGLVLVGNGGLIAPPAMAVDHAWSCCSCCSCCMYCKKAMRSPSIAGVK